ncbi:leucine-rich repeat receptor-like serine/threonine-protein kinase, partial [Fagus crenata]
FLKGQDLAGELPPSPVKLPYLKTIEFTRNYLSGNIPREWASTKLETLSVSVNNLSGPIPSFLGKITTLTFIILSANNLIGDSPDALTNLTKLTEL